LPRSTHRKVNQGAFVNGFSMSEEEIEVLKERLFHRKEQHVKKFGKLPKYIVLHENAFRYLYESIYGNYVMIHSIYPKLYKIACIQTVDLKKDEFYLIPNET